MGPLGALGAGSAAEEAEKGCGGEEGGEMFHGTGCTALTADSGFSAREKIITREEGK
jgi:hypothetical protein